MMPEQITRRKQLIWELRTRHGWNCGRIADHLRALGRQENDESLYHLTSHDVQQILQMCVEVANAEISQQIHLMRAEQFAKLERLYETTVEMLAVSRQPHVEEIVETGRTVRVPRVGEHDEGAVVALPDRTVRKTTWRAGDAALINQARGVLADIRDLFGLEMPKKVDLTSAGAPVIIGYQIIPAGQQQQLDAAGRVDEDQEEEPIEAEYTVHSNGHTNGAKS